MLEDIGTVDNIAKFLDRVKDKDGGKRLMGFGTASTRTSTRAPRSSAMCHKVLARLARPTTRCVRARVAARGDRAQGRVLHRAQALPERGLLLGRDLQRARIPRSMFT